MLTGLRIGNFKAFADTQHVPIRPITLIFGANSSGKSSIIHGLLLAQDALESGQLDVHQTKLGGEAVDLGGFRQFVHGHDLRKEVILHLEADRAPFPLKGISSSRCLGFRSLFGAYERSGVTYHVGLDPSEKHVSDAAPKPTVRCIEVELDNRVMLCFAQERGNAFRVKTVDLEHPYLARLINGLAVSNVLDEVAPYTGAEGVVFGPASEEEVAKAKQCAEAARRLRAEAEQKMAGGGYGELVAAQVHELKAALPTVLGKRELVLRGLALADVGPGDFDHYGGGQVEEDPYEYFSFGKEGDAQAIRFDLEFLLIRPFTAKIRRELQSLAYLGPLRCIPPRHVTGRRDRDPNWQASGGAAWELARDREDVVAAVNKWLSGHGQVHTPYRLVRRRLVDYGQVLQGIEDEADTGAESSKALALAERYVSQPAVAGELVELAFQDVRSDTLVSHRDIGFGISQVMPVLITACASRGGLVAIEQPELHLHPALQAELGDLFIESALGEQKNTFLLETHSEHLILRIMRRIRETFTGQLPKGLPAIRPQDVSVLYVEKDGPRSIVREMALNERGELVKAWPGGFFEEGLRELIP